MGFPSLCNVELRCKSEEIKLVQLDFAHPALHAMGLVPVVEVWIHLGISFHYFHLTLNHSPKLHDAHAAPNWWWNWPWMQDATILFFFSIPESKQPTKANDRDVRMSAKSFSRTPWLSPYLKGLSWKFDGHKYTAHIHDLHKYWWSMAFCVFSLNGFMTDRCHTSLRLDR